MATPCNTPSVAPLKTADHPLVLNSTFALPPAMKESAHTLLRPARLTREKKELKAHTFFADKITDKHLSLWAQLVGKPISGVGESSFEMLSSHSSRELWSSGSPISPSESCTTVSRAPPKSSSMFASSSLGKAENRSLRLMSGVEHTNARGTTSASARELSQRG